MCNFFGPPCISRYVYRR